MPNPFHAEIASWTKDREELLLIRHQVFVEEQKVPAEIEEDEQDPGALHLLARDSHGRAIGTARVLPSGQIGRVAIVSAWRRRGVGTAVMKLAMKEARAMGNSCLEIHAQVASIEFYEALGWSALGPVFMEAGIPHRLMRHEVE
ncbi:MAG: GNAT family N-acetyltransferase [Verrucomicrobiota bacterium]